MISREEVLHIAKLARLELTDSEIEKMQKDLSGILDYFNILKAIDVKDNKIINEFLPIDKATRKDIAISQKREVVERLIAASPDKKDDYIKVKAIL